MDWHTLSQWLCDLGGVVENIKLAEGRRGRGLFPIEPGRPARLYVPKSLLMPISAVEIVEGQLIAKENDSVSPDACAFFNAFQKDFSFGSGGAEYGESIIRARYEFPQELQDFILNNDGVNEPTYFPKFNQSSLLRWFLQTRSAKFGKLSPVLMPMIELVNHDRMAAGFNWTGKGVGIQGTFDEEILVKYRDGGDSWTTYLRWGFFDPSHRVLSIGFTFTEPGGFKIKIIPEMSSQPRSSLTDVKLLGAKTLEISNLLLSDRSQPQQPRQLFRARTAMYKLKDPGELFDMIRFANSQWFTRALTLAKRAKKTSHADTLRIVLKHQKQLLGL